MLLSAVLPLGPAGFRLVTYCRSVLSGSALPLGGVTRGKVLPLGGVGLCNAALLCVIWHRFAAELCGAWLRRYVTSRVVAPLGSVVWRFVVPLSSGQCRLVS